MCGTHARGFYFSDGLYNEINFKINSQCPTFADFGVSFIDSDFFVAFRTKNGEIVPIEILAEEIGTHSKKVFSIQNASGNGLDIVALRPDGKYDIFEVKSSKHGKFKLSERQQKDGKCFAKQVLTKDVKKGGYFMKGLGRKKTPIGPKEARAIFNNIDKTETVFVDMNSKFRATRMTFGTW